jgi:hypothetical protein
MQRADFTRFTPIWNDKSVSRVNARLAVSRARGGAERRRFLFWEFGWRRRRGGGAMGYPLVERIRWLDALPTAQLNHNFTGNGIDFHPPRYHSGSGDRSQRASSVVLPKCCGTPAHFSLSSVFTRPPVPPLNWPVAKKHDGFEFQHAPSLT